MNIDAPRAKIETILSSAKSIYVSGCASEIAELPDLLRRHRPEDATVTGIFSPLLNRKSYADPEIGLRMRTFFLTRAVKQHIADGMVDYCPWRYRMIDRWMAAPGRFDTALVMMSPPDANGKCSLGVQVDFLPRFHGGVERIVGFINPQMPRAGGDGVIDYAALAAVVDCDVPLKTMVTKPADATTIRMAQTIVELIRDDATVQFGLGQIPSQVIARLANHSGLRVHSGVVDDNILELERSGALDRNSPIVTGTAVGTSRLYDSLTDHRRFSMRAVAHTHSHATITSLRNFTAVNSVLQADLLGQVSAEGSGGNLVASPGGLPDFVRGALDCEGGRSIIAVRARSDAGRSRGIVPLLDSPHAVTNSAADADILVTEFGAAELRGLSMDARAEAIIAIADPDDQQELARHWAILRRRLFGAP